MKITSVEVGRVLAAGREKRVVTVRVRLAQPLESMRITVVVPDEGDEGQLGSTALREQGMQLESSAWTTQAENRYRPKISAIRRPRPELGAAP
jgi:hypothetical protein